MKNIKHQPLFKMLFILVVVLVLLIPKAMIISLVYEREGRREQSIESVTQQWGKEQTVVGPIVSVPYHRYITLENDEVKKTKEYIHFLPSTLNTTATIKPEVRYKGIYEVVVYNSFIKVSGSFDIQYDIFDDVAVEDILVDQAFVSLGVSDLRGIENQVALQWNDETIFFDSGLKTQVLTGKTETRDNSFRHEEDANVLKSGISANLDAVLNNTQHEFLFELELQGSTELNFVPVGKTTEVTMNSTWDSPNFVGNFLPDSREISEDGFSAYWNVLHLNRNFPNAWLSTSEDATYAQSMYDAAFGTQLFMSASNYQKSTRAAKYAVLIIILTFLAFLFIELLQSGFSRIHSIQYILVGLALLLFYSLLLAISEHLGFNAAFLISAIATLSLITVHMQALLKLWRVSALIAGILTILYGFVFVIIQLKDYALLVGTLGLFVILAIVMHFARKIDWYTVGMDYEKTKEQKQVEQETRVTSAKKDKP